VLRNREIVVENGKIARIDAASHKPDIDLSGLTVTPGWIDTHTHPGWYFDKDGRYDPGGRNSKTTPQEGALRTEANAFATLMGGFTTVQSLGQAIDVPLSDLSVESPACFGAAVFAGAASFCIQPPTEGYRSEILAAPRGYYAKAMGL
jgi:imidazolonepropionase-like amidohydrolase